MILGCIFASVIGISANEFPSTATMLSAMGADPIVGSPRYAAQASPGRWQLMDLSNKYSGHADPLTNEVRFLYLDASESGRLNAKHSGANRAESLEQANAIANAFVARVRPANESWVLVSSRKEFGNRGVPDRIAVFYGLSSVAGYGVDSSTVRLSVHVLRKSGVISMANLPYYEITSTEDSIGEARARNIAEGYMFRRLGTDVSGKRGRIIRLTRRLSRDVRARRNPLQERTPLIRVWHAEFEKYQSYLKIDARDGSLMDVFNGFPPSPR